MINWDALNEEREQAERTGKGSFLNKKDLGKPGQETIFRLTPIPASNMGMPFFREVGYWINKKRYASPASFGDPCPIAEELKQAKASGDAGIFNLLKSQNFSEKDAFYFAGLELDVQWNGNQIASYDVVDDTVKFLEAGPQLKDAIVKVFLQRVYQNNTQDGMADAEKGYPLMLSKAGTGLDTNYDAAGIQQVVPVPDQFKNPPEAADLVRAKVYSAEYLKQVIRNYLYGEEITAAKGNFYKEAEAPQTDEVAAETTKAGAEPKGKYSLGNSEPQNEVSGQPINQPSQNKPSGPPKAPEQGNTPEPPKKQPQAPENGPSDEGKGNSVMDDFEDFDDLPE